MTRVRIARLGKLLFFSVWVFGLLPSALAADEAGLADFQAKVDARLTGDYRGYVTPFEGIYSLTWPDESQPKTPVLADQALTMLANSFSESWAYFRKGNPPVEADKVKAIRTQAVKDLPLASSLLIRHGDSPVAMVIYSAVDCGFCRRLEAFLAKQELSYRVFPSSLYIGNFPLAKSVWCNANPAQAWQQLMLQEKAPAPVAQCPSYPITDIRYTGALFSYGNTPAVIFADGDVISRLPQGLHEEVEFLKIVQDKIEQGVVFSPATG